MKSYKVFYWIRKKGRTTWVATCNRIFAKDHQTAVSLIRHAYDESEVEFKSGKVVLSS